MVTCTTSQAIPPGQCINVTNCSGLNGNREIMVNPPGVTQVAECDCQDNWTLFNSGGCGPPSCAGSSATATITPVDMFFMIDKSGSMAAQGLWTPATSALNQFFQDPQSAGINAALRFFPDNSPSTCDSPSCDLTNCSQPLVSLGALTAASAPTDTQEQALVSAINANSPGGGTPMYAALGGAEQWAVAYQQANPKHQVVVVFLTDGYATSCDTDTTDIDGLAGNAFTTAGVLTYVIGLQGSNTAQLNDMAQKGGTGSAFIISGTNSATVSSQLAAALQQIRGQSVSCSFPLPSLNQYDPSNVQVIYTPGNGSAAQSLAKNAALANCGMGWYYDNNQNPTLVNLCPMTCGTIQGDPGAQIQVKLACPSAYQSSTYTQQYTSSCPMGTHVQWGYFAYNTTTPLDSNIVFKAHTANTVAQLAAAPLSSLATAQAATAPDTEICAISGPSPCPVDLYNKLGGLPNAQNSILELVVTLNPSGTKTAAPTVNNWQITYSCPPTE
jgi:hypothetical protein